MSRKKIIGEGLLLGILVYAAFISFLYFRMKNMENALADYERRLCPSSFDCRKIIPAEILDYGSSTVSFKNYGPKGIPLESGTFEEYVFNLSIDNSGSETVVVAPNAHSNLSDFGIENIYIPSRSDANILDGSLFKEKEVYIEAWRGDITYLLITSKEIQGTQTSDDLPTQGSSITSSTSQIYDSVIPTINHPVILAKSARDSFFGWTGGILFMVLSATIFSMPVIGIIYGIDWIVTRWRRKNE